MATVLQQFVRFVCLQFAVGSSFFVVRIVLI